MVYQRSVFKKNIGKKKKKTCIFGKKNSAFVVKN